MHKVAHAVVGAAAAEVKGEDAGSGAMGAFVAETVAELFDPADSYATAKQEIQNEIQSESQEGSTRVRTSDAEIKDRITARATHLHQRKLEISKLAVVTTAAVTGLNPNTALQTATNALDHNSVMGFLRAIKKLQGGDAVDEFIDTLSPGLSREYLAKDACNFVLMTRDSIMGMVDYGEQSGLSLSQMMRGNPRLDSVLRVAGQMAGFTIGTGLTALSFPRGGIKVSLLSRPMNKPLAIKGAEGVKASQSVTSTAIQAEDIAVRKNLGRSGRQAKLRDLAKDDKLGSADRGWLKQELNSIERKSMRMARDGTLKPQKHLRNPPRKELAHRRGKAAKDGYGYEHSDFQESGLHTLQHKHEGYQ